MKRCAIMVTSGTYRAPGQCAKRHGLRLVKLVDRQIDVCAHHRQVLAAGRAVAVAR